ncbi:YdcF family protein [Pseudomonas purpurea]|uniref:YdcF family protein n=1 Tax=Pseudomonas purpurea TaxID=3136737 RepID=UPI0032641007
MSEKPTRTLQCATQLWDYMSSGRQHTPSDAIIVCCSYDLRVGEHACALYKQGLAPVIIFTGNKGNWTHHLWEDPESHVFRRLALESGVPASAIFVEDKATNFGENIAFTKALFGELNSAIVLTKPNAILRLGLVVKKVWPELQASLDAPDIRFPADVSNIVGLYGLIEEMVGDIQRIIEYPKLGFQAEHALPESVLNAWEYLVKQGFSGHLIKAAQE